MRQFVSYLRLIAAYTRINLAAQLEYRGAFLTQAFAMFLNDVIWLAFWSIFFTRFPILRGWTIEDVVTVWALAASGFGLCHAIFGNAMSLATLIAQGQLDMWLLYPRPVLPHLLVGKMNAMAWGDVAFGYVAFALFVRPDLPHFFMFVLLTLSVMVLFIGFACMIGSIGFFIGNAAPLAEQWFFAMITFSTYPSILFEGVIKVLLLTAIPALFVTQYPVEALRQFSWEQALIAFTGSCVILIIGTVAFYAGLRRYESGNLMEMRG
jgi:ABC-2 type transport system permease protein